MRRIDCRSGGIILPLALRTGRYQAVNGRFQRGKSGNPGGRPKLLAPIRDVARTYTVEAIETAVAIMRNGKAPACARLKAAELILDRGWGRPVSATMVALAEPGLSVRDLDTDTLITMLADLAGGRDELDGLLTLAADGAGPQFTKQVM